MFHPIIWPPYGHANTAMSNWWSQPSIWLVHISIQLQVNSSGSDLDYQSIEALLGLARVISATVPLITVGFAMLRSNSFLSLTLIAIILSLAQLSVGQLQCYECNSLIDGECVTGMRTKTCSPGERCLRMRQVSFLCWSYRLNSI